MLWNSSCYSCLLLTCVHAVHFVPSMLKTCSWSYCSRYGACCRRRPEGNDVLRKVRDFISLPFFMDVHVRVYVCVYSGVEKRRSGVEIDIQREAIQIYRNIEGQAIQIDRNIEGQGKKVVVYFTFRLESAVTLPPVSLSLCFSFIPSPVFLSFSLIWSLTLAMLGSMKREISKLCYPQPCGPRSLALLQSHSMKYVQLISSYVSVIDSFVP